MMKLSLMRDVFTTVNSDWDCGLAADLASNWNHDETWIKMWRASANFICFIRNDGHHYVIRFNNDSERSLKRIDSEIKILHYLKSKNIRIAEPVLSGNKNYIERTNTAYGTFNTCVFERLSGKQYDIDDLKPDDFLTWGESLGKLHKAFKEMPADLQISRISHVDLFEGYVKETLTADYVELKEIEYLSNWLKKLKKNKDNYGLIHYDFELDNIIWNEEGLHLIDFDDSIYSWYAADIVYALRDLFDDGNEFKKDDEKFLSFIKGYRRENSISEEELLEMPNFYRLHHFITFKKLQRSVDISICEDNPEWLNELIGKLTNMKTSYYRGLKMRQ
ncbi:MAG: phosphotransferase [Spirochaetes bacterium]|nr:phosphotransferase [Spirochaetota bacterium]